MGDRLKGKVAIVTGAGRGIGRGEALALAAEGAAVVVNDPGVNVDGTATSARPADEVVAEITSRGGRAVANYDSVATWEGAERIIKAALDRFGRLDILVNNAGILRDRMVFNMTEEEWDAVMAVHLKGTFMCTRHACNIFRQQRSGRIINTTSFAGLIGNVGQANYGAAKAGIAGFTRVVARDMGRYGVTCNALSPHADTRMTPQSAIDAREAARAAGTVSRDELRRGPEQNAPIVVYLATDEAANINGQIFDVYGGTISLLHHPTPAKSISSDEQWTVDELAYIIPKTLAAGLENPAPPQAVR